MLAEDWPYCLVFDATAFWDLEILVSAHHHRRQLFGYEGRGNLRSDRSSAIFIQIDSPSPFAWSDLGHKVIRSLLGLASSPHPSIEDTLFDSQNIPSQLHATPRDVQKNIVKEQPVKVSQFADGRSTTINIVGAVRNRRHLIKPWRGSLSNCS